MTRQVVHTLTWDGTTTEEIEVHPGTDFHVLEISNDGTATTGTLNVGVKIPGHTTFSEEVTGISLTTATIVPQYLVSTNLVKVQLVPSSFNGLTVTATLFASEV